MSDGARPDWTVMRADPGDPDVADLIGQHLAYCRESSPPKSVHAIEAGALAGPDIRLYVLRGPEGALACGALRLMGGGDGELKSMHVTRAARGGGVGGALLDHLIAAARAEGLSRLWLETGSDAAFAPARRIYERAGFTPCAPFGSYRADPNSVFMTREI